MSASPAGHTPGRTPNGGLLPRRPPPKVLPKTAANPLVQKKKKPAPRKPPVPGSQKQNAASANGGVPVRPAQQKPRDLSTVPFGDTTPSLFTQPPPQGAYTDFPIVMSKRAIMEGLRHHVARFVSRKPVDPRNKEQFTPPLYLLRKDVKTPMPGSVEWEEIQEEQRRRAEEGVGDVERNAQREAARAEIAPSLQKKKPSKQAHSKKKNEAMTRGSTKEQKAKSQLKYEEALPWHFEDDEQTQIWMGTYEDASSNIWSHLKFQETPNGPRYVLTPVQKWYKFDPKTRYDPQMMKEMEERAKKMKTESHSPEPSFMAKFIKQEEDEARRQQDDLMASSVGGKAFFRGARANADDTKDEGELDFEEDFADDEAPPEIEGEENDVEAIKKRIKKDQLKSNVFGNKTLAEYQAEEEREKREEKLLKKVGKKTAKALFKREHNAVYEWEKDNPYSDDSDSTDTEAELEKERERKEAEEKEKAAAAAAATASTSKTGSGPGSRNNTPGNRPSKHPDPLSKAAASLKRPGSPNLSEASGNESSVARKRLKKNKHLGAASNLSNVPSRTGSPAPSANGSNRPSALANRSFAAGSGSETEGGAPRRLKLSSPRSPNGSPGPSRAVSRAGSPAPPGSAAAAAAAASAPKIAKRPYPKSAEEIRDLIPKEGIPVQKLVKYFDFDQKDKAKQKGLVNLIKTIASFNAETRLVTLKETK